MGGFNPPPGPSENLWIISTDEPRRGGGEVEVPQNELLGASKKKEWEDTLSSKEWKSTERHFDLCDRKIKTIREEVLSLYKKGALELEIDDEADIGRGLDAHFVNLHDFDSRKKRLHHIKRVRDSIGKEDCDLWAEIRGLIESYSIY